MIVASNGHSVPNIEAFEKDLNCVMLLGGRHTKDTASTPELSVYLSEARPGREG